MDSQNRLTRNDEWQVGARYRAADGTEVTFLGWQPGNADKGEYKGWPVLRRSDGSTLLPSPKEWRGRWTPFMATRIATELVSAIDFPHTRDGGEWRQKALTGRALALSRACYYADQLRRLGMRDADVACLISDLYWDAAEEMRLKAEADAADDLPPIEDLADLLAEEPAPSRVVINPDNETATLYYANPYEIDLARIKTPADLLHWTMHLAKKHWMDAERLHEVVAAIAKHKGFDLRLH